MSPRWVGRSKRGAKRTGWFFPELGNVPRTPPDPGGGEPPGATGSGSADPDPLTPWPPSVSGMEWVLPMPLARDWGRGRRWGASAGKSEDRIEAHQRWA